MSNAYILDDGIFRPIAGVNHREDEYDSAGFATLRDMQERHFWYRGRHRFLWHAFQTTVRRQHSDASQLWIIDFGGGCGGWLRYLLDHDTLANEIALGDSSIRALDYAAEVLHSAVGRYQIDLLHLNWHDRWDVGFLLDVLEHIPEDKAALNEIHQAIAPGGLLFVTTPALQSFWSYNDELAHHVRRYSKRDFRRLATACGFELVDVRYFMFFLSPLVLASRWIRAPRVEEMTESQRQERLAHTHRVPSAPVNEMLAGIFATETPLGHWLPFPWGTSILAVLQKPRDPIS